MLMSSNISALMAIPRTDFHIPEETMDPHLKQDILNHLRAYPTTAAVEAAHSFRMKWVGYKASHTEDELAEDFKICMQ